MRKFVFILLVGILSASGASASIPEAVFHCNDEGAIGTWLVLGPIADATDAQPLAGYSADWLGGESTAAPLRGGELKINDQRYSWTPWFEERTDIRISDRYSSSEQTCAYFYCQIDSGKDRNAVLQIGRDDTAKIWLSGELVYENAEPNSDFTKRDDVRIQLKKGRQPLLVKIYQTVGFWGFNLRILDMEGNALPDIKIVLPGEWSKSEFLDQYMQIQAPPLVTQDGKRLLRVRFPAYADPKAVESVFVFDGPHSDFVLWSSPGFFEHHETIPINRRGDEHTITFKFVIHGRTFLKDLVVKPCRDWRVYLLPGSHVDIGYTNLQEIVLSDHKSFFRQSWDLHEESVRKNVMKDAQYLWNPEVNWVVKDFLRTEPEEDRKRLLDSFRNGVFSLDALYCNLLTALCGDEELIRSVYFATHLAMREHLPEVASAMITDVPGYTWGIVPVLAGAGVKYFELGPNYDARIGFATKALGSHPYYWTGPDGKSKVLVWNTGEGYSQTFNLMRSEEGVDRFLGTLSGFETDENYPYDVAQFRAYLTDNTPPPAHLSEMVQEWNRMYSVPRLILSGAPAPFQDLEAKFAGKIPTFAGDYTPYWEDGAASSARETAMNRMATLQLQEADTAWSLARSVNDSIAIPVETMDEGYDQAMLFSEHTWGAHNSISQPESPFAQKQWDVKRSFAEKSLWLSTQLKRDGLQVLSRQIAADQPYTYAVWNLTQWPRSDYATLTRDSIADELKLANAWVAMGPDGNSVPVYDTKDGYVFWAENIPPFGYAVYQLVPRSNSQEYDLSAVNVQDGVLQAGDWEIKVNPVTGGVSSLIYLPGNIQLKDQESPYDLNQYLHVLGPNGADSKSANDVVLHALGTDKGPGIALIADMKGQGIEWLRQEIRLFPKQNRIDFMNVMDKSDIRDKEAVRFAFPLSVPGGEFTLEIPLASMHPEKEQIPGANRNYYTIRQWVDVSNQDYGITFISVDAPLVELCDMHAEQEWMEHLPLTNTSLFSYAMNNYWFTNYKASQGGPAIFRYSLQFHLGPGSPSGSTSFARGVTSPLCVKALSNAQGGWKEKCGSLLSVDSSNVLVQDVKWAESGDGLIVRVRELDGQDTDAHVQVGSWKKFQWKRCDIVERPLEGQQGLTEEGILPISIHGNEIQTYWISPNH